MQATNDRYYQGVLVRTEYNLYCVGGDVKHCSLTHANRIMKVAFQDFPWPFMSICHVFPSVPFNGMDIKQVRLSHTYAH